MMEGFGPAGFHSMAVPPGIVLDASGVPLDVASCAPGAHVEHVLTIHTQRLAYHNHALAHAQSTCIICNPSYPNTTEYSIYIFDLTLANMS